MLPTMPVVGAHTTASVVERGPQDREDEPPWNCMLLYTPPTTFQPAHVPASRLPAASLCATWL